MCLVGHVSINLLPLAAVEMSQDCHTPTLLSSWLVHSDQAEGNHRDGAFKRGEKAFKSSHRHPPVLLDLFKFMWTGTLLTTQKATK